MTDFRIETKCIQSGYEPGNGEPRVLPIYQSTTFRYTSSEQMGRLFDLEESGYFYTRLQNPTNDAVAAKICDLEGGAAAMLTSSGQAAIVRYCPAVRQILLSRGSRSLLSQMMRTGLFFPSSLTVRSGSSANTVPTPAMMPIQACRIS